MKYHIKYFSQCARNTLLKIKIRDIADITYSSYSVFSKMKHSKYVSLHSEEIIELTECNFKTHIRSNLVKIQNIPHKNNKFYSSVLTESLMLCSAIEISPCKQQNTGIRKLFGCNNTCVLCKRHKKETFCIVKRIT